MELSKDLVKQFAGLMNTPEPKKDTPYLFGTAIVNESGINVRIDGSQYITPASSTIGVKNNDRVAILLKNHKAIIMGNATSPAYSGAQTDDKFATTEDLESVSGVNSDIIDSIKEIQSETDKYNKMYQMVSKWSATGAVAPDVKINGGLLEAYTVISKHIAIGDFTNMVVLQTSDFTISNDIGQKYRRVTGAYGAIELASSKEVEFEVGDSYLFTFKCYSVIGTVNCIIRYYYSDGTWSDAGLTTLTFTANKLDKFDVIVKIKSLPTNNKTLTQVRYFIETSKDTNNIFDLYQEDLALRKMYAGKLIVDGSITAKSIDAEQFFTGKVGDKANSLFASLGAFEETKNLLDTTNALANVNSSALSELNTELETNVTNTNNALKSIDDLNKSFDSFKAEGDKYSVMYKMISKWANGAVNEDTLINGGLIATSTILAKHMAIGDFTNMAYYQPSDFDLVDQDGEPMKRITKSAYASIPLTTTKRIEFEVGDSYLFTFFAKISYPKAACIIRRFYSDGTWENAGSTTFDATVDKVEKHNVKVVIKTPLNTSKTLSYISFFIEISSASECTLDLYMKDLALRKMYGGNLIVDGTITADHLDANSLFVGAVGDKAKELFATVDGLLKANQKITTVEGIANGAANDIITIDGQITNLETATNKNTEGLKEANKNISTNTSSISTINGKMNDYDTAITKYDSMYKMISKWANGAISETTLIDGGLIATDTILAKHIAIGDYTNMVRLDKDDFNKTDSDGYTYMEYTNGNASIILSSSNNIEFEIGDAYMFTFHAKFSLDNAEVRIAYIYNDHTYTLAGSKVIETTNSKRKYNVKVDITDAPDKTRVLKQVTFYLLINVNSVQTITLYYNELSLRKMYSGHLIVDGTITAEHLKVDEIFARKINSSNGGITFKDDLTWVNGMNSITTICGTNFIVKPNIKNKNGRPCGLYLGYVLNADDSLSNLELTMGTQDVIDVGKLYTERIHLRHCSGINSSDLPDYDYQAQMWLGGDGRIHCDAPIMTQDAIILDNSKALYCRETSGTWVHAISVGEDNSARVFTWYTGGNLKVGNADTPETHVSGKKVYLKGQGYVNNSLISTSDMNMKNTPTSFDERYYRLAEMLNFKLFRFNDGTSGRFHSGLYAQEVEECMAECGISMDECAFVCIDQTEDENHNVKIIHSLRYDEINILMSWYNRERMRRQDLRIQALEEQNLMLLNEISELK